MPELITVGETMAVVVPKEIGKLRYAEEFQIKTAGAESNVAIGVSKMGHSAGWISSLGQDELGERVLNSVRAEGVDTNYVTRSQEYRTGLMIKEMLPGKETKVYYYRDHSAASNLQVDDLSESYLKTANIVHMTGILPMLSESCREVTQWILEITKKHEIRLSFDPNIRKKLWKEKEHITILKQCLFHANIILIGLEEAEILLNTNNKEKIRTILLEQGCAEYIAIKDGARGAFVADKENGYQILPFPCTVQDTIGAGDAFNAAFLAGILEGKPVETCGQMGGLAGAFAVQTRGDIEGMPDRIEMERYLNEETELFR